MKVLFGLGPAEIVAEARDEETARVVARYLEVAQTHDYWLRVYDAYGTRTADAMVEAKVLELDDEGEMLFAGEATGSPAGQVFALVRTLPEDAVRVTEALIEPGAQIAWKQMPKGTFYLPVEWANHTKGLPNVSPLLVERWDRGEKPRTITRWRLLSRPLLEWGVVLSGLLGWFSWYVSCRGD